jgi:N-dimethylarginine dimethylaminohydrolase
MGNRSAPSRIDFLPRTYRIVVQDCITPLPPGKVAMTRRDVIRSLALGLVSTRCWGSAAGLFTNSGILDVKVEDEFAPLKVAIVHDGSNAKDIYLVDLIEGHAVALDRGQKHPESGPVLAEIVVQEMARYRKLLVSYGVEIISPKPVEDAVSQIFTRDPLFVVGKSVFLGNMLDDMRAIELEGFDEVRERIPDLIDLSLDEEIVVEGGDVMVLNGGKTVLVGTNLNTNEAGFNALADHLTKPDVKVHRIRHHRLHLDCCLAPLPNGSAFYQRGTISKRSMPVLKEVFKELIHLDPDESSRWLATNLLWLDPKTVVSGTQTKKTNERLKTMGYKVETLDFNNVKRMWGSFRCATCPIRRG